MHKIMLIHGMWTALDNVYINQQYRKLSQCFLSVAWVSVPDWLVWLFLKWLIIWDFHIATLEFTQNGAKRVESIHQAVVKWNYGRTCLVDQRSQWRMAILVQADRLTAVMSNYLTTMLWWPKKESKYAKCIKSWGQWTTTTAYVRLYVCQPRTKSCNCSGDRLDKTGLGKTRKCSLVLWISITQMVGTEFGASCMNLYTPLFCQQSSGSVGMCSCHTLSLLISIIAWMV